MKMYIHYNLYFSGKKNQFVSVWSLLDDCIYSEVPKCSLLIPPSRDWKTKQESVISTTLNDQAELYQDKIILWL